MNELMHTGAQRAATLLLAMERTTAQALLRHFSPEEIREVTIAASRLGEVPHIALDTMVDQFQEDFSNSSSLLGDEAHARELIGNAVSADQLKGYLETAASPGPINVWKGLATLPEKFLVSFLADENPLIVTYILSRLDSPFAAKLVSALPRDMRNAALVKLIAPPEITPAAQIVLEAALRDVLLGGASAGGPSADDARARIADIINGLEPTDADDVMKALEAERPQDARAVRTMLFSFTDLTRLAQRARALLFDKLTTDLVVMALRNTDAEFREAALSAMAARSRRLVEGELAQASNAKPAEIAKARMEVVRIVLAMAARGELDLPSNDSEDGAAAA